MSIFSDSKAEIPAPIEPQPAGAEDDELFSRFFDQYHESVYSVAWRILGDEALASNVTETAFCQAWRASAHRGACGPEQRRWLLWLTHGIALSVHYRDAMATAHLHAEDALLDAQAPVENGGLEPSPSNAQRIVELAFWSGLTCREIAESCRNTTEEVLLRMRAGLRLLVGESAPAMASPQCCASICEAPPPASPA